MRLLVAIVLLVSWSVTGSLSLSVGTIISPSSLLDDGALISPSSVSVSHLMKLKQKKHTSYGALHLLSIKPTDSAPAEQDNVASQSSVKTKATQELGNPTSDLFDKDPRTGPTKEESHTVHVTPSPSFVLSYFKQLTKLSKDPTHAQLLEKILPQKNQVETLKSREKREVNDSNAGNDDDHDEDTDGVTRASSRMAQSLLSKVFHSRTLTPSLPTRTLTTLPAGRAARLSGRTRATQPRTQSASGVTQTQQKITPVGLSRRHRSTVSYTRRCPQLSELKAIMVQVSRYSKDEIRNMIRCLDLRQRRLRARTTTTTSTTAPRRCRSRTDDVADAKARDLLTVG